MSYLIVNMFKDINYNNLIDNKCKKYLIDFCMNIINNGENNYH